TEEQFVLHYYGELAEASAETETHLSGCSECRSQYQTLQRVLNTVDAAPVPERAPNYEAQVWRKLAPQLPRTSRTASWLTWFATPQKWMAAAAMAALLMAAFVAGRFTKQAPATGPASTQTASNAKVRERLLLVAVGEHLERSQMVLVEVANAGAQAKGNFDITYEQTAAEDLVEANRIYRQTAVSSGDAGTASLLDDLERTLLEIAHSPASVSSQQMADLRHQIEERGLLFKVKVFQNKVNSNQSASPAGAQGTL
ncbi:MAG: hypothetical protein ABI823_10050, partial [Bryobacteraceae bacterium]